MGLRYSERPPRDEYVLTDKGRDFRPVLMALTAWGNRHMAGEDGPALVLLDRESGKAVEPVMVDAATGQPLTPDSTALAAGPGAGPEIRSRLELAARRNETKETNR
ncbi:winged helix-turn-helix transcriptional regulator [Streptomyces sp. NPDC001698]|uniref:winged helix-turn-helix transcriptional regulator n=2 Tax=unclassified Streptomyces TaxID=2593676 RepID=UPI0036CFAE87